MTVYAVTREIDRLAAVGRRRRDPDRATLAIARQLTGGPGNRNHRGQCPLARHLAQFTESPVQVTRYEVRLGDEVIPLNRPPGDRLVLREFVCAFDDKRQRFRWLRATSGVVA